MGGPVKPPEVVTIAFSDDEAILIGEGVDLLTAKRRPSRCITPTDTEEIFLGNKDSSLSEVIDDESLLRKLNTSITARGNYAGYSAGGSMTSSVETKTSSKNQTFVVKASLLTKLRALALMKFKANDSKSNNDNLPQARFDLTNEAVDLLKKSPAKFRQVCGDGFVSR